MRNGFLALLVASTVVTGAPRLFEIAKLTVQLARLPDLETRRATLFGPWYSNVRTLREEIPRDATVDFIMLRPEARDIAVLGAAELQPRDVRLFDGWTAWELRTRAELLRDARAANAAPGPPPSPARFVIAVDPAAAEPLRKVQP